jgi:hypothetical protein
MIVLVILEVAVFYAARVPDIRQRGQRCQGRFPFHRGKHNSFSADPVLNHGPRYYKIHGSIHYDLEEVLNWIRTLAVAGEQTTSDSHSGALA